MSGCPIGECDICGEMMYEGEWDFTGKIMHHEDCKVTKYISRFAKLPLKKQRLIFNSIDILAKIEEVGKLATDILNMCDGLSEERDKP